MIMTTTTDTATATGYHRGWRASGQRWLTPFATKAEFDAVCTLRTYRFPHDVVMHVALLGDLRPAQVFEMPIASLETFNQTVATKPETYRPELWS
jgi:hypothetical protein